jgi:hypothetical protein
VDSDSSMLNPPPTFVGGAMELLPLPLVGVSTVVSKGGSVGEAWFGTGVDDATGGSSSSASSSESAGSEVDDANGAPAVGGGGVPREVADVNGALGENLDLFRVCCIK